MLKQILLVEDDEMASDLFHTFLTKSGFHVIAVDSAEAADKILGKEEIDMIITDIKLPGLDGIQFTKKVRKNSNIDVIVMTGYSSEYSYEDAIKSGASDLIFKPIKLNELLLRINRVTRERSLLDQRDKMIKKLQKITIEDPLTGLFNSRHLYDQLETEIKRAERYLHPISLMFIDVDNFKSVNDQYGHMIGDKILSLIAKRLREHLRAYDTAYRFAGDEFTIMLPETGLNDAKTVADRILTRFSEEHLTVGDNEISTITLSIGITEYQINEGIEQFLHRADVIMYEAKRQNGNSVVVAPESEKLANINMPQLSWK